mmetsp:Transcript_32829/g.91926  ORF Transcript_32829/g.91926 Transcript_32829/m.91926 type:complete len:218 (-) Transcript_32829:979-1632(-)
MLQQEVKLLQSVEYLSVVLHFLIHSLGNLRNFCTLSRKHLYRLRNGFPQHLCEVHTEYVDRSFKVCCHDGRFCSDHTTQRFCVYSLIRLRIRRPVRRLQEYTLNILLIALPVFAHTLQQINFLFYQRFISRAKRRHRREFGKDFDVRTQNVENHRIALVIGLPWNGSPFPLSQQRDQGGDEASPVHGRRRQVRMIRRCVGHILLEDQSLLLGIAKFE